MQSVQGRERRAYSGLGDRGAGRAGETGKKVGAVNSPLKMGQDRDAAEEVGSQACSKP